MFKSNDPLYRRIRSHAAKKIRFQPSVPTAKRLKGYKQFLKLERQMIVRHHRNGDSGLRIVRCGTILTDVILESIVRTALLTYSEKEGTLPCQFSLVGLGGYGRGELNPLSDVDIMFLFPDKVKNSEVDKLKTIVADEVLYPMWDLGFKVGHSTRTIKECIEESQVDYKTRNSLLEHRCVLGSSTIHQEMNKTYRKFLDGLDIRPFLEEMIQVQDDRRSQYGGSVFAPEPNVKNGVGGLRDYQGIQWLLHLMYGDSKFKTLYKNDQIFARDMRDFEAAYDFQLRVRNELHFNSKRATDELTLVKQQIVANQLGYSGSPLEQVEGLMKDYYFHARNSLRIARSMEERVLLNYDKERAKRRRKFRLSFKKVVKKKVEGFLIENDRVSAEDALLFDSAPEKVFDLFRLIQVMDLKLSFELHQMIEANLNQITPQLIQNDSVKKNLWELLTTSGKVFPVLEAIYESGVFERVIPEFQELHCLVQHDKFMVRFAEDQKVLKSIQRLDQILQPDHKHRKWMPELRSENAPAELYLALLLNSFSESYLNHSAPGVPDRAHVDIGAILQRLGVTPEMVERILGFIEKHNKVARFWQQLEAEDRRLVDTIAQILEDEESANMSFWLYYCESLGRNPQYWRVYDLGNASEIFSSVVETIQKGDFLSRNSSDNTSTPKDMTRVEIKDNEIVGVCADEIDAHFQLLPNRYFESRTVGDVELHIQLVHQLLETIQEADSLGSLKPVIDWTNDPAGNFSVITVVTWDRSGLFYKLAGAISAAGMNILKARAISRKDHIAIDTFYVNHGKTGQIECDIVKSGFEKAIESILVEGEKALGLVRNQYETQRKSGSLLNQNPFDPSLPVQVDLYYDEELKQVVADYQGKDRIGLLYRVARTLTMEQLNIDSVRIATNQGIATGTLFLSDENVTQKHDPERFAEIREHLIAILSSEFWLVD